MVHVRGVLRSAMLGRFPHDSQGERTRTQMHGRTCQGDYIRLLTGRTMRTGEYSDMESRAGDEQGAIDRVRMYHSATILDVRS